MAELPDLPSESNKNPFNELVQALEGFVVQLEEFTRSGDLSNPGKMEEYSVRLKQDQRFLLAGEDTAEAKAMISGSKEDRRAAGIKTPSFIRPEREIRGLSDAFGIRSDTFTQSFIGRTEFGEGLRGTDLVQVGLYNDRIREQYADTFPAPASIQVNFNKGFPVKKSPNLTTKAVLLRSALTRSGLSLVLRGAFVGLNAIGNYARNINDPFLTENEQSLKGIESFINIAPGGKSISKVSQNLFGITKERFASNVAQDGLKGLMSAMVNAKSDLGNRRGKIAAKVFSQIGKRRARVKERVRKALDVQEKEKLGKIENFIATLRERFAPFLASGAEAAERGEGPRIVDPERDF